MAKPSAAALRRSSASSSARKSLARCARICSGSEIAELRSTSAVVWRFKSSSARALALPNRPTQLSISFATKPIRLSRASPSLRTSSCAARRLIIVTLLASTVSLMSSTRKRAATRSSNPSILVCASLSCNRASAASWPCLVTASASASSRPSAKFSSASARDTARPASAISPSAARLATRAS